MAPFADIQRRATAYQPLVIAAARKYGLPASLLNGLIAQESQFVNGLQRIEPHLPKVNGEYDGSSGLVQILFSTARALGYRGRRAGLNDPATNIDLGARFFADQVKLSRGDIPAALSRYNGGYRPGAALGARAKTPVRGIKSRNPDGTVRAYKIVPVGQFLNQEYVDAVLGYAARFKAGERRTTPAPAIPPGRLQGAAVEVAPADGTAPVAAAPAAGATIEKKVWLIFGGLVLVGGAFLWARSRRSA